MEYRQFGPKGLKVSALGFGSMRLPKDMDQAVAVLRSAIDGGVNYIDTSRGYGDSELKIAQALKDGYRDKVLLSTKCSPWIYQEEGYTASADDTRRKIDESMARLEVDYLDFYQVWNVTNAETYALATAKGNMVDAIHSAMDEGIVGHIAATAHAPDDVVLRIIESGIFETVTLSYHLLDRRRTAVMKLARAADVGVVVMNPMGGGVLGIETPVIQGFLPEVDMTSKQLALRYVLDSPGVSTAISGLASLDDVAENLATEALEPLTDRQVSDLAMAAMQLDAVAKEFCTQCGYCMPCPQQVNIKHVFNLATRARLLGVEQWARDAYAKVKPEHRAEACTQCGQCLEKCTNSLDIPNELVKAHEYLS